MPIFNIAQANFLFNKGIRIINVIKGERGEMGLLFDKYDKNFKPLMDEWKRMSDERRVNSK